MSQKVLFFLPKVYYTDTEAAQKKREDITIMAITGRNVGKTCRTHYKGTFNDGTQFDSSYDRGEPLEFVCGAGQMIQGFDAAVADMEVGEVKEIHLMPEEAYGQTNPDAIFDVEIADLPGSEELQVGQHIYLQNQNGQHFPVTVTAKTETTITFDANHEMAGKELNFKIELVEVKYQKNTIMFLICRKGRAFYCTCLAFCILSLAPKVFEYPSGQK